MMKRLLLVASLSALALTACGRPSEDADVKFVGVGADPDEIGPSPTAYGGIVEYDHVDLAGAGLPLGLMGLSGYDAVGPQLLQFAPPYEAVFGFSYIFDQKLSAADTLVQIGGAAPDVEDSCYTVFEPAGPIGSFNTVDVGDFMEFFTEDGERGLRFGRFPTDYPPDPQNMFIYYIGLQSFTPKALTHRVPGAANPTDPRAMEHEVYRKANYPFGEKVFFTFRGGFSRFDQPVSSIPRPSVKQNELLLPEPLGGVLLEWDGPRYDHEGNVLSDGAHSRCWEFYEGRPEGEAAGHEDCLVPPKLPTKIADYDAFRGQMYTAPWDTTDGKVRFQWQPGQNGSKVVLSVRFLEAVDTSDVSLSKAVVTEGGAERPATACEEPGAVRNVFDEDAYTEDDGALKAGLQGDPTSNMISVTCLLADDGEFELDASRFQDAAAYLEAEWRTAGGAVFYLSRVSEIEADVPAAKDPFDQRHDISPVKIVSQTVRIGRFWCEDGCTPSAQGE